MSAFDAGVSFLFVQWLSTAYMYQSGYTWKEMFHFMHMAHFLVCFACLTSSNVQMSTVKLKLCWKNAGKPQYSQKPAEADVWKGISFNTVSLQKIP